MNEKQKTTLVHAIKHFGVEGQINKAVEEMGELITELSRRYLPRYDKDRVAEEVADALIMLEQLRIIFGASKVDGYIAEKLERLEKTINGDPVEDRLCCLFCTHLRAGVRDHYCGLTGEDIIGEPRATCCGRFKPTTEKEGGTNE